MSRVTVGGVRVKIGVHVPRLLPGLNQLKQAVEGGLRGIGTSIHKVAEHAPFHRRKRIHDTIVPRRRICSAPKGENHRIRTKWWLLPESERIYKGGNRVFRRGTTSGDNIRIVGYQKVNEQEAGKIPTGVIDTNRIRNRIANNKTGIRMWIGNNIQSITNTQVNRILRTLSPRRIGENQCQHYQQQEYKISFHLTAPLI